MIASINFNTAYGDLSIVNGDIQITRNTDKVDTQAIINYFKTNEEDCRLTPDFGFHIDKYIGRPVSEELATEITLDMTSGILGLGVIDSESDLEIMSLIKEHSIFFRLLFSDRDSLSFTFIKDEGFRLENEY